MPQCIRAYKDNIAGFGIGVKYIEDIEETPEAEVEYKRMVEIIELLNTDQDTKEVFEDLIEARETYGIAYLEVIRNLDGEVQQIEFLHDTPSVRKTVPLEPYIDTTYYNHGVPIERKRSSESTGSSSAARPCISRSSRSPRDGQTQRCLC